MKFPETIGGIIATSIAAITTIGVYILENFVINFSLFDFCSEAFSTKSIILATVESSNFFVTLALTVPFIFTHPDNITSSTSTLLGTLSPVIATVFKLVFPSITTPSIGTFCPGEITIISPTSTVLGSTLSTLPFLST